MTDQKAEVKRTLEERAREFFGPNSNPRLTREEKRAVAFAREVLEEAARVAESRPTYWDWVGDEIAARIRQLKEGW